MLAEQNRPNMKNNNLIRFVQSLVLLPVITASFPFSGISNANISQDVLVKKVNIEAKGLVTLNKVADPEAGPSSQVLKARAEAIDARRSKKRYRAG